MFKKIILANFIIFFLSTISWSEIITDVKIEGNKRISKESLMVFGEISKGSDYNQDELNEILKKIYLTNFFKNISLNIENYGLFYKKQVFIINFNHFCVAGWLYYAQIH